MDTYDPDIGPDAADWMELAESDRIPLVLRAHKGRQGDALHTEAMNEILHASLHAVVETQIASGKPAAARSTLQRLAVEGLTRHAALHAMMKQLAEGLAGLRAGGKFDQVAYEAGLNALSASAVIAGALDQVAPKPDAPNRAQRRAAKKNPKG
jgi:hypothetical protein